MKQFLSTIAAVSVALSSICNLSAQDLWERSYEKMKENGFWYPSEVTVCEEIIDHKGNLKNNGCMDYHISCKESINHIEVSCMSQPAGEVVIEDVGILNLLHQLGLGVPFFVEKNLVQIHQREDSQSFDEIDCIGYDFKTEKDGKRFAGTVWLNPTTASPVQVNMQLTEDEPLKFDGLEIDHFYRTIQLEEKDGIIKANRLTAEAWVSNRSIFRRSLVVKRYDVSLRKQWKAM